MRSGLVLGHRPGGAQGVEAEGGSGENALQQIGLGVFQRDETAQHMQNIDQFGCVFGQPAVGLDLTQRRGRAPVPDDGGRERSFLR